ncbi:MAG: hypothetical protein AB7Q29_19245 [Vicinamibacterales bacterium]
MPIEVTTNFDVSDKRFVDRELMREIGLLAREAIVRRTARGVSAEGQPFQPYSAAYARRKAQGLGSASPVNLSVSGGMLGALQIVEISDTSVTLGFG